jgi:hypothetical protein
VDFKSPLAAYAKIPRSYVILQRINLGLFAILGEMNATANWRAISEEIWPFLAAPPSTPMGEAEAGWHAACAARLAPPGVQFCAGRAGGGAGAGDRQRGGGVGAAGRFGRG